MSKTESINSNTQNLDQLDSEGFVKLYLEEDKAVWAALNKAQNQIAKAIDLIYKNFENSSAHLDPYNPQKPSNYKGPRVFYIGAGTSGRLGILDASECLPTFSVHPDMIQGIIAGGQGAMFKSVEGAEDDEEAGYKIISETLTKEDTLVGISANGGAPYVIGALKAAKDKGSKTIAIANNSEAKIFSYCDQQILLDTGAEVLSGSTRLKAGTAQKITLNMISTGLMIKLGKVYGNLMVDLQATNIKLVRRATNLVMQITGCDSDTATAALKESNFKVKHAVLKITQGLNYNEASELLIKSRGYLRKIVKV